jgi:hypothetical protein
MRKEFLNQIRDALAKVRQLGWTPLPPAPSRGGSIVTR